MSTLPDHVRKLVAEIETEIGEEHGLDGHAAQEERQRPIIGTPSLATPTGPVEEAVREILVEIGEDPDRQGLVGTPDRVHRMYAELTAGYHVDPDRLINGAVFDVDYSEMVVVKDIPFYSLCEHHLLPFFGMAHVAYIPKGRVIGLSKIPRIVEMYARRLQVQERHDPADRRLPQPAAGAAGRRRRRRGEPPVRDHARHPEARHDHDDVRRPRALPLPRPHPRRVLQPPRAAPSGGLNRPMTTFSGQPLVDETLARMDEGWAAFHRRVQALAGPQVEQHLGRGTWTRKQMLAHISTWHDRTVEALGRLIETGELPGAPEDTDAINARAARAAIGRTTGEVLFALDDSYRLVRRAVGRLTEAQLTAHDGWATAMIAGNTYDHYTEHLADLDG